MLPATLWRWPNIVSRVGLCVSVIPDPYHTLLFLRVDNNNCININRVLKQVKIQHR